MARAMFRKTFLSATGVAALSMGFMVNARPADAALVYSLTVTDPGNTASGFTGQGQITLPGSQGSGKVDVDFSFEVTSYRSILANNNIPQDTSKIFGNDELDSSLTWETKDNNSAFQNLNLVASFLNDLEFRSILFAIPPNVLSNDFCDSSAKSSGYFCLASADGTGIFVGQFSATLVPVPAALPLFATAVFGIGVFSIRRRRQEQISV